MIEATAPMTGTTAASAPAAILCVDDEPNILHALRRLFRSERYTLHLAESGQQGLELLGQHPIDLVISDMRMPGMDGAQFLAQVSTQWPAVVRFLLTGASDLDKTIDAINEGHIYRYISKPWEDNELKLSIRQALEQKRLREEKDRLEALTKKQNELLKTLNATLEQKVRDRTAALSRSNEDLETAYRKIKKHYKDLIPVFAQLIEMNESAISNQAAIIADIARAMAEKLGITGDELEDIYNAALLHNIGKIGLSETLLKTPYTKLSPNQQREVRQHAQLAQGILMSLEPLENVSRIIRSHTESFNGRGYPDGLKGADIPVGSRIIAIARYYVGLRNGLVFGRKLALNEALEHINQYNGARYDPALVKLLLEILAQREAQDKYTTELKYRVEDLAEGMVLSRDLVVKGVMLLKNRTVLTPTLIRKVQTIAEDHGVSLEIYIGNQEN